MAGMILEDNQKTFEAMIEAATVKARPLSGVAPVATRPTMPQQQMRDAARTYDPAVNPQAPSTLLRGQRGAAIMQKNPNVVPAYSAPVLAETKSPVVTQKAKVQTTPVVPAGRGFVAPAVTEAQGAIPKYIPVSGAGRGVAPMLNPAYKPPAAKYSRSQQGASGRGGGRGAAPGTPPAGLPSIIQDANAASRSTASAAAPTPPPTVPPTSAAPVQPGGEGQIVPRWHPDVRETKNVYGNTAGINRYTDASGVPTFTNKGRAGYDEMQGGRRLRRQARRVAPARGLILAH